MKVVLRFVAVVDHRATGALFRAARLRAGLSCRGAAERIGVSAAYVSDSETGKRNWTQQKLDLWCKALAVTTTNTTTYG